MKKMTVMLFGGLLLAFGAVGSVSAANYDPLKPACDATQNNTQSATCNSENTTSNPLTGTKGLLEKITNIVAIVAGFAAIIMIMIGGFRYITANGDAQSATNARKTVLAAVIGLIVIVAARSLIVFVLRRIS